MFGFGIKSWIFFTAQFCAQAKIRVPRTLHMHVDRDTKEIITWKRRCLEVHLFLALSRAFFDLFDVFHTAPGLGIGAPLSQKSS